MKSNVEKVSSLARKLNVEVPAQAVATLFDKAFKDVQKHAKIKGFRPGKAPLTTVRNLYGDQVRQDVIQELIQKHYYLAVREHNLKPISYPEFEFDAPTEGQDFSFSAAFEVRPEVQLKTYQNLEIQKEKLEVTDARIQQVVDNILAAKAALVDVLEDRAAQKSDVAIVDFEGFVNGAPLENGSGKDHHLELGAQQFIEGFEDGVIGMKVGQQKTLSLRFPDPYHAAELAGKPVDFKVTLKGLKKKELPQLTDEFVRELMGKSVSNGEEHSAASLRKTIHDDIEQSEKKRIETDLKNRVLKALVKANPVEVPASMLKDQKQALIEEMKSKMLNQGLNEAQFVDYANKWDQDFETTAAEMIQSGFIVNAIAEKHDLICKPEDLEAKYEEYAKQTGIDVEKIKDFYSRPEQENRLTYTITEDKVLAFVMQSSKVSEVSAESLKG